MNLYFGFFGFTRKTLTLLLLLCYNTTNNNNHY